MDKNTRIFIGELVQDLPLWISLIMGTFPKYQNEKVFFLSLAVGIIASIYLLYLIKKGDYNPETFYENKIPVSFFIYTMLLMIILTYASWINKLYMDNIVWGYIVVIFILELIFSVNSKKQTD